MPRRYNPCSYLPRRLQIVASLTAFVLLCIIFLGSSTIEDEYVSRVPYGPQLESGAHHVVDHLHALPKELPHVNPPHWLNPFRAPAHTPPPEQANSTSGDAKWFSDFKWRNPFSSSVTLDEDRAVLPPLRERVPVYTYFDPADRKKDKKSKDAEQELLHVWRRAWWAQGFKPVVLGRPEAMNNPLYRRVQALELESELELEMMRWLAWANMGTGILCNWLALPMAHYHDSFLNFLRHGEYPDLTRYKGLANGLFLGSKADVDRAIQLAIDSKKLKQAKSIADALPEETFTVDPQHDAIAFYSNEVVVARYIPIKEKLEKEETRAEGLAMLAPLINSHLHMTWQNRFTKGISVMKPLAQYTTDMLEPAIDLARNLTQCASTPIPTSCPPNMVNCKPCVSSHPMSITTYPVYRNKSELYTIATVPHPYTIQSLIHDQTILDTKFIRRKTTRDTWLMAVTKELLGTGISSFARLADFKDIVASEYGTARSLWLTAENPPNTNDEKDMAHFDWAFGFTIPRAPLKNGKSETPVPGPERRPDPPKQKFDGPTPTDEQLSKQKSLLNRASEAIKRSEKGSSHDKELVRTREMVEAWNLADAEAWKFVRAFEARRGIERRRWEEEEETFIASGGKGSYGRWKDYMSGDE